MRKNSQVLQLQVMQKQSKFFDRLPRQLIYQILIYLPLEDIFLLENLPDLKYLFQPNSAFLKDFIKILFNITQKQNFQYIYSKLITEWKYRKIINLPFWGSKTDAGVLYHSIPFWVGKGFLKTKCPIFGFQSKHRASAVGYLAQDYYEFEQILISLSKLMKKAFDIQEFKENIEQINLKFVIMHAFHAQINGNEDIVKKFNQYKNKLYAYAIKLNQFLQLNSGLQINNSQLIKLPLIANIHQIQFSRQYKEQMIQTMKNTGQTIIITTNDNINSNNYHQLSVPSIYKTNFTKQQLKSFHLNTKLPLQNEQQKYILFKPNEQGLILWLDMGKKDNVGFKLQSSVRFWSDKVNIIFSRGREQSSAFGITFSYVSLKGLMI